MANVIKPKRSAVASNIPTTAQLVAGEIALNMADKKLYFRDTNDNIYYIGQGVFEPVDATLMRTTDALYPQGV